jgi:signal transduction histidine kinase/CheY-like chemotaxis protein
MNFKFNKSNKKLLILLMIFIFSVISHSILNYSLLLANQQLDSKNKNLLTVGVLGENIVHKLRDIKSLFYQLVISDGYKQRSIINNKINNKIKEVNSYLDIIDKSGSLHNEIDINTPAAIISNSHKLNNSNLLKVIEIDVRPKLNSIRSKANDLTKQLEILDRNKINNYAFDIQEVKVRQIIKHISPLFAKTIENANRIYYEFTQKKEQLEQEIIKQKSQYNTWQVLLTIFILVLGFLGFYTVGKQMKSNNKELQERKDYVDDILQSQSGIVVVNDGVKMFDASGGFFKLFNEYSNIKEFLKNYDCICNTFVKEDGFLQKEVMGLSWVEFVSKNPNQEHKAKIILNNKTYIFKTTCVKSARYDRYIISMFDITKLEQTQKDLEAQKNKAIDATNSKSIFLANMSHEIRTPLNAILGFIDVLKDKKLDKESIGYLNTIYSSGQSLLTIINDILDFSKIENSRLIIDPIDFDTKSEFKALTDLFTQQCIDKNINFKINFDNSIPKVLNADILRIKQVVTNILSNAIKFTNRNKSIYFDIYFKNNFLNFVVKDEGIGINKEDQKHIFNEFSQAKSSITRKYGGTGLGLSISLKLIKLMNGELTLQSNPNIGSIFSFVIPVKNAVNKTPSINNISNYKFNGFVLLVEDNLTNQMLMKVILGKQNIKFDIANNGKEAVEKFKLKKYDLILMDESMPIMQGTESCRTIREYEKNKNLVKTPIVALTANTMEGDKEKFFIAGMDGYLSKPIEMPKLIEVFVKFLKKVS